MAEVRKKAKGGKKGRKKGRKNRRPGHKKRVEREKKRIAKAGGPKNAKERGFAQRHGGGAREPLHRDTTRVMK